MSKDSEKESCDNIFFSQCNYIHKPHDNEKRVCIGCPKKNCLFKLSELSKLPRMKFFLILKITAEMLSLSKFRRHLVDIKIVKIRHLFGHINYINQNMKNILFFVKRNPLMLLYMYQVFSSPQGHLFFLCIFSLMLRNNFLGDTQYHAW